MSDETKIQWHEAFCAAMESTLIADESFLTFEDEHALSRKSLKIDLVICKLQDSPVSEDIGKIFRRYNLLEYKSPGDELSIDTFYKGLAYACLYKSLASSANKIKAEEISITFAREDSPKRLFDELVREGKKITLDDCGIYLVYGYEPFAIQILVIAELDEKYFWLKSLTRNLNRKEAEKVSDAVNNLPIGTSQRRNGETVLQTVMHANKELFEKMKEENAMIPALRELFKPEMEAAEAAARAEGAKEAAKEAAAQTEKNTALRMLKDNKLSITDISKYSGLTIQEVENLQKKMYR